MKVQFKQQFYIQLTNPDILLHKQKQINKLVYNKVKNNQLHFLFNINMYSIQYSKSKFMIQENEHTHFYENQNLSLTIFVQQSENCELIIGKISLKAKKQIRPLKFLIAMKGMYRIWDSPKKQNIQNTESNIELSNIADTINQFENVITKRNEKIKHFMNGNQILERQEYFLQGKQKIAQLDQETNFQPEKPIIYPFLFNIPANLPSNLQSIKFAGKRIEIKYFIIINGIEIDKKQNIISSQFQIVIRQSSIKKQNVSNICNLLQYRCFTRFFCRCLGTYHIELNATILRPGQIQIEGRVFRQGKTTQKIINGIQIQLIGELKKVKKLMIAEKKMVLHRNDYEMLEGEVLLSYDSELKSFQSQLMTIRFWVECRVQFNPNIWKFLKKDITSQILL